MLKLGQFFGPKLGPIFGDVSIAIQVIHTFQFDILVQFSGQDLIQMGMRGQFWLVRHGCLLSWDLNDLASVITG